MKTPASANADYGDFNFAPLMNTSGNPKWEIQAAWDMPDTRHPHMKVLMYSSSSSSIITTEPHHLLHEELLLVIIDVMLGRLNTQSLRPHIVAPVILFSVTTFAS
ncbi:uncharacterized protein BDW47DRAFT_126690 [Aspergillus candidus]|uniref:Uncharacterized protein n=1 Tax=Aspergillus candidus TaxID=41067 RepID=A0A2I2F8R4_ASPCN|nr:hypothetical protein BDW47DRAFT_126690 [Aspergillus candidus]PLB37005.1 hypothetical protein BDW47DRAFT_126690 [Aspergillus candidus]